MPIATLSCNRRMDYFAKDIESDPAMPYLKFVTEFNSSNQIKKQITMNTIKSFGILALFACAVTTSHAAVIYNQVFTGSNTTLAGTTSTVGGGTWTGANLINLNGNTTATAGAVSLAFTPQSGFIYDLTATINVTAANSSWLGLAFNSNNTTYGWFSQNPAALRNAGWQIWPQSQNFSQTSDNILLRLDTTAAQWTTSQFQGGIQIGTTFTYAPAANPTIAFVSLVSEGLAVGSVSAFELTAIPEPSTSVLLGLGAASVLFGLRRRKLAHSL